MVALVVLASCASTKLVNVWEEPKYSGGPFKRVLVVGVSGNYTTRRSFEDEFVQQLRAKGVEAVASYTLIPAAGKTEEDKLRQAVSASAADAVLMSRLTRLEKETQYSPGYVTAMPGYGYHSSFYGFYSSAWTYYTPPQVYQYDVYTIETNLWQVAGESLIWSATTETFDPGDEEKEIKAFAQIIIGSLAERNLI